MFQPRLVFVLALTISRLVASQNETCYNGYIMDKYCIDQGFMIDNGLPTLTQPEKHSVHCLVEISVCVDSGYEVLVDVNASEYERAVELDSTGNTMVRALATQVGGCGTCANPSGGQMYGFAATVVGVLDTNYTGTPPRLLVTNVYPSDISCENATGVRLVSPPSSTTMDTEPPVSSPAPLSITMPTPTESPVSSPAPVSMTMPTTTESPVSSAAPLGTTMSPTTTIPSVSSPAPASSTTIKPTATATSSTNARCEGWVCAATVVIALGGGMVW